MIGAVEMKQIYSVTYRKLEKFAPYPRGMSEKFVDYEGHVVADSFEDALLQTKSYGEPVKINLSGYVLPIKELNK